MSLIQTKQVKLLRYGRMIAYNEEKRHTVNSITGYFLHSDRVEVIEHTDVLNGAIGLTFGVEYYLEGHDANSQFDDTHFTCRILHPIIVDPATGVEVSETIEDKYNYLNDINFDYFTMEYAYEVKAGTWLFQILQNDEVLLEKAFSII